MASKGFEPSPFTRIRKVTLSFRLPYFTQWGQNLMVCGSDPALGAWKTKQGLRMSPRLQAADALVWHATLTVPHDFSCDYSYYLVDDQQNVLRSETGKRHAFALPHGLPDEAAVEIYDLWQVFFIIMIIIISAFPSFLESENKLPKPFLIIIIIIIFAFPSFLESENNILSNLKFDLSMNCFSTVTKIGFIVSVLYLHIITKQDYSFHEILGNRIILLMKFWEIALLFFLKWIFVDFLHQEFNMSFI
jgi:hypothetical protein